MKPVPVDIDSILDDFGRALYEHDTGRSQSYHSEVRHRDEIIYLMPGAWQSVYSHLHSLDTCLSPLKPEGAPDEDEPSGVSNAVKGQAKKLIRKAVYWYVNPVLAQLHGMHAAADRLLHEITDILKNLSDRVENMEDSALQSRLEKLEGERFDERIGRLEREWRQGLPAAPPAPVGDGRPAAGADRPGAVEHPAPGGDLLKPVELPARQSSAEFQFDYYWFESIHRGDRELIKSRQHPYLEYFSGCSSVLDIGCGKGEFLELLREKGIGGYGIDIQDDVVRYCQDLGLKAVHAEGIDHLKSLPDQALDGVFISQVVEHLTPGELIETVGLVFQKVRPGSCVVVETPNPQCLLIFASFFYADLSHVQPVHSETMKFLFLSAGFQDVEIKMINPVPRSQRLARMRQPGGDLPHHWVDELNSNLEKVNSVLFGYMDYAAVARRR